MTPALASLAWNTTIKVIQRCIWASRQVMAKGFGKPQAIPTRDATKFMVAFAERCATYKGNKAAVQEFLTSNLNKLDKALLKALPLIFRKLLRDKKLGDDKKIGSLFFAFGASVYDFQLGDRAINLELSMVAHQIALKVTKRDLYPEKWAEIKHSLGNTYRDRIQGNRTQNLEQAIQTYEQALEVHDRNAYPERWAAIQNNLGWAYSNRIQGDRAENLEQAIVILEQALQVCTRNTYPERWAGIQNNIGNAYSFRIRGDRVENLEASISAYKRALQIHTRDTHTKDWAVAQNNLGYVYSDRIRGDRAENLQASIIACEQALQFYTREAYPEDWARALHNLANTYCEHILGKPLNLQKAIDIYHQAAQVFTRDAFPYKWAENQGNWAEALIKLAALTSSHDSLDTAIEMLKESLEVAVPGSPVFIDSQYRLGTALSRRFEQNQDPQDLQQALKAYKTALDAISPEHYDRAKIWQALPTTQSVLGSRLVREGEWQEGLELLLNSVRLLRDGDDPLAHANALYQTARAHETLSDWDNARLYYRDALRLYDHVKDELGIAKSRHGLGSVLVSQGYLAKGMSELQKALTLYQQLDSPDKVAEVESLYQTVQQAEQHMQEVAV